MKLYKTVLIFMAVIFTVNSCKKDPVTPVTPPQKLVITIEEQFEAPPSRVSVFFKVETKDGDPVAGLTEDNFQLYEKGRNDDVEKLLSQDEATRLLSDNSQVFRYYTILLLDLSGSVLNNSLAELKESSHSFIDDLMGTESNAENYLGIWFFDGQDELHQLSDFTTNADQLHTSVSNINTNISEDSSTDLYGAILKSTALAESKLTEMELQDILSAVSIIVFTDGTDQAARYSREDAFDAVENAPYNLNYYTIGLGGEIDEGVLNKIGKDSFVFADNTDALSAKFEEIATLIFDEANSYYLLEYCTPKRDGSGISELHMIVTKDNAEGKRITTFDAAGFYDDCDLN